MNYLETLKNKKIIVLGLGVTGLGIVRFLLSHKIRAKVVDSRQNPPGKEWLDSQVPQCEVVFGSLVNANLSDADLIIISPGIPLYEEHVAKAIINGVEVIGDIELFARLNDKPVVAVTGSNGKSTVVSLVAEVLIQNGFKVGLGGNIGTPVLSLIAENVDIYVLELSSFQLETTYSLKCTSAMILNVTEDHMDRYPNFPAYTQAKQRIYLNTEYCIFNANDVLTRPSQKSGISVGLDNADYCLTNISGELFFSVHGQALFPANELKIPGSHNQFNALAVMALLSPFSIQNDVFTQAFKQFDGLPHRCQFISEIQGVRFFNDSKATNVGATIAALESISSTNKNIILIVGGDAKGAQLSAMQVPLNTFCKAMYCYGKDAKRFLGLSDIALSVPDLNHAVQNAFANAQNGDIILLAPACASTDMYPNYIARGEHFCEIVKELAL